MFQVLMFYCLNELVADMVVDPDVADAKSQNTQWVLVIVGRRAVADCVTEKKKQVTLKGSRT